MIALLVIWPATVQLLVGRHVSLLILAASTTATSCTLRVISINTSMS